MLFRPPEFNFKYNKRSAQAHLRLRTNPQSPFQFSSIFVCFILFAGVLSSVDQPPVDHRPTPVYRRPTPVDRRHHSAYNSTKLPWAGSIRLRRPTPVDRRHHSAYNSTKLPWAMPIRLRRPTPVDSRQSTSLNLQLDQVALSWVSG